MPITIEVHVLPEDIEGAISNGAFCPVARAMQRTTGDTSISAWYSYLDHRPRGRWRRGGHVSLPQEVRRAIRAYDKTGNFQPMTFTISLPASWIASWIKKQD